MFLAALGLGSRKGAGAFVLSGTLSRTMAFRSELDAAQERADAAEAQAKRLQHELDAQSGRMARVAEVEAELESARARLRTARPEGWSKSLALWAGVAALVGAGAAFVHGQGAVAREREICASAELGRGREIRIAAAESETVRAELLARATECEDSRRITEDERADLRSYLASLATPSAPELPPMAPSVAAPMFAIGQVTHVEGNAPVAVGAFCGMSVASDAEGCSGVIVCDGVTVHRTGCDAASSTRMNHEGFAMDIVDREAGWRVDIAQSLRAATGR